MNINSLGIRLDGWADTVEGAHDKAEMARNTFLDLMRAKELPEVSVSTENISNSELGGKRRPFVLLQMNNGATVAVYIAAYGKELYAAWNIFVRAVINTTVFLAVGIFAFLAGIINGNGNYGFSILGFLLGFIGTCILGFGGVSVAGIVTGKGPFGFFFKQLDAFDADDIGAMTIAAHKTVLKALDCVGIPSQSLRVKEQFKGGTRERII